MEDPLCAIHPTGPNRSQRGPTATRRQAAGVRPAGSHDGRSATGGTGAFPSRAHAPAVVAPDGTADPGPWRGMVKDRVLSRVPPGSRLGAYASLPRPPSRGPG